MKNNHRANMLTRSDVDNAYKLNKLFENPNVYRVIVKCSICEMSSRRKPLTRQQFKRIVR